MLRSPTYLCALESAHSSFKLRPFGIFDAIEQMSSSPAWTQRKKWAVLRALLRGTKISYGGIVAKSSCKWPKVSKKENNSGWAKLPPSSVTSLSLKRGFSSLAKSWSAVCTINWCSLRRLPLSCKLRVQQIQPTRKLKAFPQLGNALFCKSWIKEK